ncbi:MAG: hypothetical protein JWN48_1947 [Myxococcaceae bacterium]|nr:hypothetical protein [Myxococcaceae bacterium]
MAARDAVVDPTHQRQLVRAEVAAVLYTLLGSAKLARLEPRSYLRAAAEAALCGREPLLPHVHREQARRRERRPRTHV